MSSSKYVYRFGRREYDLSSRTFIMGVLNLTPDSFSDGGEYLDPVQAVERAHEMIEEGADFIDVGGESTRPRAREYGEGADAVDVGEELRRIMPVIKRLAAESDIPISVDTYKARVAAEVLQAGATLINDVSGLHFDSDMAKTVSRHTGSLVVMHMKGTPKTMQADPHYSDLFGEVSNYLLSATRIAEKEGIRQIIVDPGIGFGKTQLHNLQLINGLKRLRELHYPILVGHSRKSFLGTILNLPVGQRLEGSLAAGVVAALRGAHILRVHDVKETKRALMVADAIMGAASESTTDGSL